MSSVAIPGEARRVCYRCFKPQVTCVCDTVDRVENRTEIIVFQHPRERFHPLGTARLVRLGLERARVETLWPDAIGERPAYLPVGAALLYPSANARDLATLTAEERPSHLVAIDGTWANARTLHRDTPWLKQLPHVRLSPAEPSRYRIRREPHPSYLSTVEAIIRALEVLEPETPGLDDLMRSFDRMIDRQIELGAGRQKDSRKRLRDPALRGIPRAMIDDWDRMVIVYGESSLVEARDQERELVQWTAIRAATGEIFEALLGPSRGLLRPWHLVHMGLSAEDLSRGMSVSAFGEAWRAYAKPDDILIAWNQGVLDLLVHTVGHEGPRLALKSILRSVVPSGRGGIEDLVSLLGVATERLPLRGRAADRLGNACALTRHLRRSVEPAPASRPSS